MVVTVVRKLTAVSAGRSSVGRQRGSPGGAGDGSLAESHSTLTAMKRSIPFAIERLVGMRLPRPTRRGGSALRRGRLLAGRRGSA